MKEVLCSVGDKVILLLVVPIEIKPCVLFKSLSEAQTTVLNIAVDLLLRVRKKDFPAVFDRLLALLHFSSKMKQLEQIQ